MCHILLQHYIHCRHSNLTFYPCTPYLSRHSSHSPLHPNYIAPKPHVLFCRGILRSDGSDGRHPRSVDSGREEEVYGLERPSPPAYQVVGSGGEGGRQSGAQGGPEYIPSEWRDHSKPKGVAHSYHRLCPECVGVRVKREEMRDRERNAMRNDVGGVGAWQVAARSGRLAEGGASGSGGDGSGAEGVGERGGDGRGIWVDRERRNAVVGIDVGVVGDGRPGGSRPRRESGDARTRLEPSRANVLPELPSELLVEENFVGILAQRANAQQLVATVNVDRHIQGNGGASRQARSPLDEMQADLQRLQERWTGIVREGQGLVGERSWEDRVSEAMRVRLPTSPPLLSANFPRTPTSATAQPATEQRQPSAASLSGASRGGRAATGFLTLSRTQPSTRRASTGGMEIMPGVVERGRMWNATRRWRWEREGGRYRVQLPESVQASISPDTDAMETTASQADERILDAHRRLMNTRPVVATLPPVSFESTSDQPVVWVTTQQRPSEIQQLNTLVDTEQTVVDRFMWPRLFLQGDPSLNVNYHPVNREPYNWIEDGTERTSALGILYQLIDHHQTAGLNFDDMTVSAAAYILPWYQLHVRSEVDAANATFKHLRYIGRVLQIYGRARYIELVGSNAGASREVLANALVKVMAEVEGIALNQRTALSAGQGVHNQERPQLHAQRTPAGRVIPVNSRPHLDASNDQAENNSGDEDDAVSEYPNPAHAGRTPCEVSGVPADLAFERLADFSNLRNEQSLPISDPNRARPESDIRVWDPDDLEINRAMFQHLWTHATVEQFDQLTAQRSVLRAILATTRGQEALNRILATLSNLSDAIQYGDRYTLMARRIQTSESDEGQLEIVSPTGSALRISWDDLLAANSASSRLNLITQDIMRLVDADLSALYAVMSDIERDEAAQGQFARPRLPLRAPLAAPGSFWRFQDIVPIVEAGPVEDEDSEEAIDVNLDDSDESMPSLSPTDTDFSEGSGSLRRSASQIVERRQTDPSRQNPESDTWLIPSPTMPSMHERRSRSATPTQSSLLRKEVCDSYRTNDEWAKAELMRQIEDCPDHPSGNDLERDWPLVCNDATHGRSAEHRDSDQDVLISTQHYRRSWSHRYGKRACHAREHLNDATVEILVTFSGCSHHNIVFVERLRQKGDIVKSHCGCHSYDRCLTRHRRARSAQSCLKCQFDSLIRHEMMEPRQVRELTELFEKQVRLVTNRREALLWPFGARDAATILGD